MNRRYRNFAGENDSGFQLPQLENIFSISFMFKKLLPRNKDFWSWALIAGVLFAFVALLPQIDLWSSRGANWNGAYAIGAYDEPAYAAYLQSIIDGKPRRNSPYSGRIDTVEDPQKESLFSIQFFSTYPLAITARIFGLSSSTAMILLSIICGFASAFAIFWLIYLLSENAPLSFVGTLTVLLSGSLSAGQGNILSLIFPDKLIEHMPVLFLRRTNPAVSFPILFLFFVLVWKFLAAKTNSARIAFSSAAILCFAATVYSYYFHWTAALAWFFGLMFLWAVFKFDDFRKNIVYFLGIGAAMVLVLVPYLILLSNRSSYMDSIQLLVFTREPDLWRVPELISYLAIFLLALSFKRKWLDLDKSKYIFLLSLSLVAPMVFNQQVLTGRSLQPFHYQLFCVNYISSFVLLTIILMLMAKKMESQIHKEALVLVGLTALLIGYVDIIWGNDFYHDQSIRLDELTPIAERIKSISKSSEFAQLNDPPIVMSFDLLDEGFASGTNLPSLSSQSILWSVHILMFPDIDANENICRLQRFVYYHNFDGKQVKNELEKKFSLAIGFFGPGRVFPPLTTETTPITEDEIDAVVKQYEEFRRNFSYEDARMYRLSFVLVGNGAVNDLSAVDRWYERDSGEHLGPYILYRVKLRNE